MRALTGLWLLTQERYDAMRDAYSRFDFDQERYEAFIQRVSSGSDAGPKFVKDGSTARIPVIGELTREADFFFDFFSSGGGTLYGDIIAGIAAAEADDTIDRIVLEIDSPGGEVAGFFEAAAAITAATKPTEAQVTDMAASAAFGLASVADSVVVNNTMASVGSVGVATGAFVSEDRVDIASTEAPEKRPDLSTDEGVAMVRKGLDAVHAEFAGIIATGRGTTVADVNANFGRGGMVIAAEALAAGMIDGIGLQLPEEVNEPKGTSQMTLDEFKAEHSALFVQVMAAGNAEGVTAERARVSAHMSLAEQAGNVGLASEFVAGGQLISDPTAYACYAGASMKRTDLSDRSADNENPGGGAPEGGADNQADVDQRVIAMFDRMSSGDSI